MDALRAPVPQDPVGTAFAVGGSSDVGLWSLRPTPHAVPRTAPLTSYPGRQITPAFALDGKKVAFAWNGEREDNLDIYVKLVDAGTPLKLTSSPATEWAKIWMVPAVGGDAGSDPRIAARRALAWHWFRLTMALCDRDSRRINLRLGDEHLPATHSVCLDGSRARYAPEG